VYVNDYELAVIRDGQLAIRSREDVVQTPYIQRLELELDSIEKGGYEHFMLKEIFEQPRSILDSMRGRLELGGSHLNMAGFRAYEQKFVNAQRIIIVACGTSWHAGLVAEYLIEDLARVDGPVAIAVVEDGDGAAEDVQAEDVHVDGVAARDPVGEEAGVAGEGQGEGEGSGGAGHLCVLCSWQAAAYGAGRAPRAGCRPDESGGCVEGPTISVGRVVYINLQKNGGASRGVPSSSRYFAASAAEFP
jgi:hypothetical protein